MWHPSSRISKFPKNLRALSGLENQSLASSNVGVTAPPPRMQGIGLDALNDVIWLTYRCLDRSHWQREE